MPTAKGGVYQKDQFHIMQEIVRDVPKEYQNIIKELVNTKQYEKIQRAIEGGFSVVKNLSFNVIFLFTFSSIFFIQSSIVEAIDNEGL